MKFYQQAKFKALQKKWYEKLASKGFEDAEDSEQYLKTWESFQGKLTNNAYSSSKADYYRLARQFLNDYTFKTKKERKIFEMHVEGIGYRPIAKKFKTYKNKIAEIVQNLRSIMRAR